MPKEKLIFLLSLPFFLGELTLALLSSFAANFKFFMFSSILVLFSLLGDELVFSFDAKLTSDSLVASGIGEIEGGGSALLRVLQQTMQTRSFASLMNVQCSQDHFSVTIELFFSSFWISDNGSFSPPMGEFFEISLISIFSSPSSIFGSLSSFFFSLLIIREPFGRVIGEISSFGGFLSGVLVRMVFGRFSVFTFSFFSGSVLNSSFFGGSRSSDVDL